MTTATTRNMPRLFACGTLVTDKETFGFDGDGARIGETPNILMDAGSEGLARVVAAAPDLLSAVEARNLAKHEARAVSKAHPDGERIPTHIMARVDQFFAKADALEVAALAKAHGAGTAAT